MTEPELQQIESRFAELTCDLLEGGYGPTAAAGRADTMRADLRRVIAQLRLLRDLLREADDRGYLKTKITSNETELEERVSAALSGRPATVGDLAT